MDRISMRQGDDESLMLTFTYAGTTTSTPYTIGAAQFWFTVKNNPEDTDTSALIAKNPLDFMKLNDNQIVCFVEGSLTSSLESKDYYYDIQYKGAGTFPNANVLTLSEGILELKQEITRRTT